jgi:hypothetical protein
MLADTTVWPGFSRIAYQSSSWLPDRDVCEGSRKQKGKGSIGHTGQKPKGAGLRGGTGKWEQWIGEHGTTKKRTRETR